MYALTLKEAAMPLGPSIFRLVASARHTSGKGTTGAQSPSLFDGLEDQEREGPGAAPASDALGGIMGFKGEATLVGWQTPQANDSEGLGDAGRLRGPASDREYGGDLRDIARMAGWPTPMANDGLYGANKAQGMEGGAPLCGSALLAGWKATDGPARVTVQGEFLAGQASGMVHDGWALNPAFSAWLMSFPLDWGDYAPGNEDQGQDGPEAPSWGDVDWLFCRDGKWRPAPTQVYPLAPKGPGRRVRLKGFGNAIVVRQAEAFIRSVMEVIG